MDRGTFAEIDLSALTHNFLCARKKISQFNCRALAVVKSNAYGHGVEHAVTALSEADGFAVAFMEEALALRKRTSKPILSMEGFFSTSELEAASEHNIDVVLHAPWQQELLREKTLPRPINVWLKLNCGMNRLGLAAPDLIKIYKQIRQQSNVAEIRLFAHFASADDQADEFNILQICAFDKLRRQLPDDIEASMANSAAILTQARALYEWVRPGIMLYGGSPLLNQSAEDLGLKPVMTLYSKIISIYTVNPGESVGYGRAWTATQPTKIGVVAIGYGDGYPRGIAAGTPVLVDGIRSKIVGRVSMDTLTVDLSAVANAQIGSKVTLWGKGLPVEEIATAAKTISYELFCQLTERTKRRYV